MEMTSEDSVTFEHFNEDSPEDFPLMKTNSPLRGQFYAVYLPNDMRQKDSQPCTNIFQDKLEAMKIVKKTKKARFKHFEFYHEAIKFASAGIVEAPRATAICNGSIAKETTDTPQVVSERMCPFKGPKPQDLVKLRKSIETGDIDYFQKTVWENPRFLISNGDTPSILQEGFRYNGLHVAAKAKNGFLAESLLSTVSNPKFVQLLYGDDSEENTEYRIQVLLDLYLNTPDRGLSETPLHFASKFGAADVVEVLVSFSQCDKRLKNKLGQTPDLIVCDRCDKKDAALHRRISMLLENSFYVPVLRADDNCMAPVIGEPFSPGSPAVTSKDPLSPRLEIHAYAGPMNREGAEQFRKVWKTPPRTSTPIKKKQKTNDSSLESVISLKYTDPAKGLERLGQKLASQYDVTWKEYWSFLDCFIDIASEDGLILFENFLAGRVTVLDGSYPSSPDSPEVTYRHKSLSTISDLCFHMQNCNLNDDSEEEGNKDFSPFLCIEKACNVFANRLACEIYNRLYDNFYTQVNLIEAQVKQVELLILSYMDDSRFNKVNLSFLHSRLGQLTAQKLCTFVEEGRRSDIYNLINKFVNECIKAFDCFSSDDEGNYSKDNKPTSSKKQLICLVQNILNNFNQDTRLSFDLEDENVCRETWNSIKECNCVFDFKRARKNLGLSRNSSFKHFKSGIKNEVSKKLCFYEEEECERKSEAVQSEESDDEFFTPPSSPTNCDTDEEFDEAVLLSEIFIDSEEPTKTDCEVYKALKFSGCQINPEKYPQIYRWYHNINLYTDGQRDSWPCPKRLKPKETMSFSTPPRHTISKISYHTPPSSSWLRITGANSPKTSSKRQN